MVSSVTILIPTHNRAYILARALASLRALHRPDDVWVEAVVIANACTDGTGEVVRARAGAFPFDLRLVDEPVAGLNAARNRGAQVAMGEVIAYLDDDAFVEPEWLEGLLRTFARFPADLVAGRTVLWWEAVERPSWSSPVVEQLLSRLELGPDVIELQKPGQLVGANFAVRRRVVRELGGFTTGLDRAGSELLSGGDTEFALRAHRTGYRLFYSPEMSVRHWVAPARLSDAYLDRLARARGRTRVVLADRTGGPPRMRLLKEGLAQTVAGGWRELRWRVAGDRSRAVAGRLTRMRGVGKVVQILRGMVTRRWKTEAGDRNG